MKTSSNLQLFVFLVFFMFSLGLLSKDILGSEQLLVNSLSDQLTQDQIKDLLDYQHKKQWLVYILIPLLLLIKVSVIAALLDAGCFFFEKEIKYRELFNMVLKAEYVFLIVIVIKTTWFYFFQTNYSFQDLQNFYPLSALNITGYNDLPPWFIYPLQVLNIFELAYWLILAYFIEKEFDDGANRGLTIVASSYGVGLLIWVVAVMFFTLNMS